jgi:uncharacterized Zn-finger protein
MFKCPECGNKESVNFNYETHTYECTKCDYIKYAVPILKYCQHCGYPYFEVTWFLPSSCPNCNFSFVE